VDATTDIRRTADLRNYILVTGAYWADTITDGAIRLLVLFYFYERGYSPIAVATLFLFYEFLASSRTSSAAGSRPASGCASRWSAASPRS